MIKAKDIITELCAKADKKEADKSMRFFKTELGQYGYGDKFLGLQLVDIKNMSKKASAEISLQEVETLLQNPWHEIRTLALSILIEKYQKGNNQLQKEIFNLYLKNTKYVNNWDLVDMSAHKIVGDYIFKNGNYNVLYQLSKSGNLWQERISVVACWLFIKKGSFDDIIKLSEYFLSHKHDLMHKAVGWMLREMGKMDVAVLKNFLDKNATKMPRTALRYSLEKFDENTRKHYMNLK